MHLLLRGQPPSHIRIADLNPPARSDLLQGAAAQVGFVTADISDRSSVEAAFAQPWPSSASGLPLTVFHTAAVIRPAERSPLVWDRTRGANVDGTRHCLEAARRAGADVFVFTSSVSVALRPCGFLVPPWANRPRRWFQVLDEADFDDADAAGAGLRPRDQFFANYAYSKALSERLVHAANGPGFRTGCVRPGNGIYGMPKDLVYADFLGKKGTVATCCATVIQNAVSSRNVSLAHLCFEAALLEGGGAGGKDLPGCAGRPLVVTDPGPPPSWEDFFRAARLLSSTPVPPVAPVPPVPLWLMAHVIEMWSLLLARFPALTRAPLSLREPRGDVRHLQPAVFSPMAFVMCADDRARRSVAKGGIGYKGAMDTLEGVCELLRDWNRTQEAQEAQRAVGEGVKGGLELGGAA